LRLALEASQGLRVARDIFWQELQGDEAVEPSVLGLIDDTHSPTAELLDNAVVRDGLPEHKWANLTSASEASQ
jgi:hypothetical protein